MNTRLLHRKCESGRGWTTSREGEGGPGRAEALSVLLDRPHPHAGRSSSPGAGPGTLSPPRVRPAGRGNLPGEPSLGLPKLTRGADSEQLRSEAQSKAVDRDPARHRSTTGYESTPARPRPWRSANPLPPIRSSNSAPEWRYSGFTGHVNSSVSPHGAVGRQNS